MALVSPPARWRVAGSPTAMTLFLLSLLALSVAAVIVTIRAVGQARDGFEDAAGFHEEARQESRALQEDGLRPAIGARPVGFAS